MRSRTKSMQYRTEFVKHRDQSMREPTKSMRERSKRVLARSLLMKVGSREFGIPIPNNKRSILVLKNRNRNCDLPIKINRLNFISETQPMLYQIKTTATDYC